MAISVISVSSSSEECVWTSNKTSSNFDLEDPSSDHIPPLPAIEPFLSSTDDSSDSDIPNTTPSPIHDHFASDDSSQGSSSSPPTKTSSDPSSNDLSDSSFDHSLLAPSSGLRPSHHLCSLVPSIPRLSTDISDRPSHDSSSASPSRKRSRSPIASVLLSLPIPEALSYARADLLPSPKRIRSPESVTDLEAEIDECIAYADALRVRGIDARVLVEAFEREDRSITGEEGAVESDQGHRIVATGQQSVDMLERIKGLEQDNMRLRDMMDVASQRVTRTMPNTDLDLIKDTCRNIHNKLTATWAEIEEMEREEMEMEEIEMEEMEIEGLETEEEIAITSEDLCLLESAHIKTS
ncbi:hypothetical protein Tco_0520346 [Tanacetum coccineum]